MELGRGKQTSRDETVTRRSISKKERMELFNDRKGICHICGNKIYAGQDWEVEHIIPMALGGDDRGKNLDLAHIECHRGKTKTDVGRIAKAKRQAARHVGKKISRNPLPCGKGSKMKKKLSGEVVLRGEKTRTSPSDGMG